MLSEDLIHEICFQPGRVGNAGMDELVTTNDPSVPLKELTFGSGGVEEHPGLAPDVQRGLQPGSLAIGTSSL